MTNEELREKAGEVIFNHDLDMGSTTVKELVDILLEFGESCARYGYRTGSAHQLLRDTPETPLFHDTTETGFINGTFKNSNRILH